MSAILGFGVNQYRQYEEGYMPSETNGKILKACQNPIIFETFVQNSRAQLGEKAYTRITGQLETVKKQQTDVRRSLIFGEGKRTGANGFAPLSLERLRNLLLYFIHECEDVFNTKMNKLLFYADFYHYRQHGQAISGLSYRAIKYGPVPVHWDRAYSLFDDVRQEIVEFDTGITGTKLVSVSQPDLSLFSESDAVYGLDSFIGSRLYLPKDLRKDIEETVFSGNHRLVAGSLGTVLCEPVVARPVDSRMEVPFYADRQLLREAAMPEKKKWRNSQQ